jgi:hypothetical protein
MENIDISIPSEIISIEEVMKKLWFNIKK